MGSPVFMEPIYIEQGEPMKETEQSEECDGIRLTMES